MTAEDRGLLKYAGLMGHPFVAIVGDPGLRRVACEANTKESAVRLADDPTATVYCVVAWEPVKKWRKC